MRILFLSGYSHPSHHRKVELLADTPEVEILHILPPGNGKEAGRHFSANGRRQYRVEVVPMHSLGRSSDPHRIIHWPPRFYMKQFQPDLVHCEHEQESLMAFEVSLARSFWAAGIPLVLYSWQNILRQRNLLVRLLSRFTLLAAQHIVCASQEAVDVLIRQGYKSSSTIMPLVGLDTRYFFPKPVPELRQKLQLVDSFVVGYFGRLVPEKGVDLLLGAVTQVKQPLRVLIVGNGPEKSRLRNLARELEISNRCHFVDEVAYDSIPDYMNVLDLLVLPSRTTPNWKEQFGRVLVEAMACKVVVAGSSSGAIPEVIGDQTRIFPEGDTEALARIIDQIAADFQLRRRLGESGYQCVLEKFTPNKLAEKILSVWQTLV